MDHRLSYHQVDLRPLRGCRQGIDVACYQLMPVSSWVEAEPESPLTITEIPPQGEVEGVTQCPRAANPELQIC